MHIQSGIKLLAEVSEQETRKRDGGTLLRSSQSFIPLADLEIYFNRLDMQAAGLVGTRPMELSKHGEASLPGFCASIPPAFTTLEEAGNSLDYHWNHCLQLLTDADKLHEGFKQRGEYLDILTSWKFALDAFVSSTVLDRRGTQLYRVLRLCQMFYYISIHASPDKTDFPETNFDPYYEQHKQIVVWAQEFLRCHAHHCHNGVLEPYFCLGMNLIAPLYSVAHHCRDPLVRREAVQLLKTTPRQEGVWDSILTGNVAESLIEMEERGLPQVTSRYDIPESARVRGVKLEFDTEGKVCEVKFARMADITKSTEPGPGWIWSDGKGETAPRQWFDAVAAF
ncbi:uncharacterized protein KY384_005224 [Bacidia gigantensis]|uniref:uncharacterized protein n=1 Tax=Bacidia gigantensis TaxID=2732470 RepID=UPI001D047B7A|nr:uncharacterized protein KY384_005224 [Bacidia gigantensis]KAG8529743.1 hypothetical protein KY384_005224 [Bacidia gigantensis]